MSQDKKYTFEQALAEMREGKKTKFDQTVELHVNISLDPKKQEQQIRFITILPHGTGKEKKVAVVASQKIPQADLELTDADLKSIEKGKLRPGRDFDVVVAEPRHMAKLAQIARVLGPAGAMPNPKSGTVTEDVAKAVEQIKKGRMEIKMEQNHPIIHSIIGKLSFKDKQLVENYKEFMSSLRQNKPQKAKPDYIKSAFINATMGKSFQLEI